MAAFFTILSFVSVSTICVPVVLWVYCVHLQHSNSYILLYRSYFLQVSSNTLIYIENFLVLAVANTPFSQQRLIPSLVFQ